VVSILREARTAANARLRQRTIIIVERDPARGRTATPSRTCSA